jgi:hypothetical protein
MSLAGKPLKYSFSIILKDGEFCAKSDGDWDVITCMEFTTHKLEELQLIYVKFFITEDGFTLGLAMDIDDIYLNGKPVITKSGNNAYFGAFSKSKNPSLSLSTIAPLAYINDSSEIIKVLSGIYRQLAIFLEPPLSQEYINSFNVPLAKN